MDVTRRTYTRAMRVFSDSARTVRVRWFRCLPDARPLGVPTVFHMGMYDEQPLPPDGLGEVYADPPQFRSAVGPPTATGQHACSPDPRYWTEGEPYRPDGPPAERDAFGVLACCSPDQRSMVLRIKVGGETDVSFSEGMRMRARIAFDSFSYLVPLP